jgi:hypothetical protein
MLIFGFVIAAIVYYLIAEGSWTQGGGRGTGRPPGPPSQNQPVREQGQERPNLGGPTPPPMSLGQGGPAPPPLGAYPMQYRGMPPFVRNPNALSCILNAISRI